MSFGFSVGDFIAVGNLAWQVWKSCKAAPESFKNVSQDVLSLHAVLKEFEEFLEDESFSVSKEARLATIMKGCQDVLQDLQALVLKYESLGYQTKRTWDRLRWHSDDVAELRARLTSSTVLLTAYISTSQIVVKKQLDRFMQEYKDGKYEASVITTKTVDSLSTDEKQAWRAIRKELEDIGVSVTAFDANKTFILKWFREAMDNGGFEEQQGEDDSTSLFCEEDPPLSVSDLDEAAGDYDFSRWSNGTETLGPGQPEMQSTPSQNSLIDSQQSNLVVLRQDTSKNPTWTSPQRTPQSLPVYPLKDHPRNSLNKISNLGIDENGNRASPTPKQGPVLRRRAPRVARIISRILERGQSLHKAIRVGDYVLIRKLISDPSVNLDWRDENGFTPLCITCDQSEYTIAKLLLQNGANANIGGNYGTTALHKLMGVPITDEKKSLILLLLEMGANPNSVDMSGTTPLRLAAEYSTLSVAKLLLDNKADVNFPDYKKGAPILGAAKRGSEEMIKLLLEHGAYVNFQDVMGDSPLHIAAREGLEGTVRVLIQHGAKVDFLNRLGQSALYVAIEWGCESVVRVLLEHGANVNLSTQDSEKLLWRAEISQSPNIITLLLEHGAKS